MVTSRGLNLHLFPSPLNYYARVSKIGGTLIKHGVFDKVEIVGRHEDGLSEVEEIGDGVVIKRNRTWNPEYRQRLVVRLIVFLEWYIKVFWRYRKTAMSCVNCRSLAALPLGILFKVMNRCPLVYDVHELETETYMMTGLRRKVARLVEKLCIGWVDFGIFVSDSITDWYKNERGIERAYTIRNVPRRCFHQNEGKNSVLRERFRIPDDAIIVIYQGLIAKGRGLEPIFEEFAVNGTDRHLVVLGKGVLVDLVKEYERTYENIHYVEFVPLSDLLNHTIGADIGIHLIENCCLNHYYCLPNKIFEYTMAGLPVIVSGFPEMKKIVGEFSCGWTIDETGGSLGEVLKELTLDKIEKARKGAFRAGEACCWEEEEKNLVQIFELEGFSARSLA